VLKEAVMGRALFADALSWAEANFGGAELGRADRTARLVFSAARVAEQPGASFPAAFADLNDLRCFYNLMHRQEATHHAILAAHFALTKAAMDSPGEVILVVHDTTDADFTHHPALRDRLGPIGDGGGRGFLQHNSLAVRAADGVLLGLAFQQLVTRQPAPPGETSSQRQHRQQRESVLWRCGYEGVGRPPDGCTWVNVCDRGGDEFESLYRCVRLGQHALVRACQDRRVLVERPDGGLRPDNLMSFARGLPGRADDVVEVSQKGGRPARRARVKLGGAAVWIEPPKRLPKRKQYPSLRAWVARVWEPEPPEGEEALEWVLISTLPAGTAEELLQKRDWYSMRWPVAEDYHQAEKTGCREEQVRFRDVGALKASLALLSVVAVRLVQMRQMARACPQEPASEAASGLEIEVLAAALGLMAAALTVGEFVRGVARLGGFLGRKCDGQPGWKVLWRGYAKLQSLAEGALLYQRMQQRQGTATPHAAGDPQRPP
jgi:hypothetical protein